MAVNKIRQFGNRTIPTLKDKIPYTDIVNDLTTGGTQKPLSAEQGKYINSSVAQEVSDRTQAIIDLKGGVSVDGNTLNKLNLKINQEVADRQAAIAQEISDRNSAVSVESARAIAEESRLDAVITSTTNSLNSAITSEGTRAIGEESRIETKLDSEISTRIAEIGILNGDVTVAGSVDQKVKVETDRALAAEAALGVRVDNEETRALTAEGVLQTALTNLTNTVSTNKASIETALGQEITNRSDADTLLSNRLYAIESGLVAGVMWKGAVADMAALDALSESAQTSGWAYYVSSEKDVYVVLPDAYGDYQPAGWSNKSFLKIADFTELSGLVTAEKNRAIAAELLLTTNLTTEVSTRTAEVSRIENLLTIEVARAIAAEVALGNRIDAEETARTTADTALETAYRAADVVLEGTIATEIANRIADVNAEEDRAIAAEGVLSGRLDVVEGTDTTVGSIAYAVKVETTRATTAEALNAANIAQEIADRTAAISAIDAAYKAADTALDARLDLIEGDKTVAGSIAAAEFNAKAYFDIWAPQAKLEGMGGDLSVVGDTVSLVYAPMVDGILLGEVVVYAGDNDSEAVAVNVANITGNTVTLDVVTAGEFDGKKCKVHYLFREGDQTGASFGVAGEGGAGF